MVLKAYQVYANNPWRNIKPLKKRWISKTDLACFKKNSSVLIGHKNESFYLNYPPAPFIGNPAAGIYLLLANPGIPKKKSRTPSQIRAIRKNLNHTLKKFYPLHKDFQSPWWKRTLYPLLEDLALIPKNFRGLLPSSTSKKVSERLFCLELCGYHSKNYNSAASNKLNSVGYARQLLIQAIKDRKLILMPRAVKKWLHLVPELYFYSRCHIVGSNHGIELSSSSISPSVMLEIAKEFNRLSSYRKKIKTILDSSNGFN